MLPAILVLFLGFVPTANSQTMIEATARAADAFEQVAPRLVTTETLCQHSLVNPPHALVAIGAAALDPLTPRFFSHEVVSEYTIGRSKGGSSLLEFRALISFDGNPLQTREKAREALSHDLQAGDEVVRKHVLEEFARLGLVDVATDYGTILLAFTTRGLQNLQITPAGEAFIGAEQALRWDWVQTSGGALEFRRKKAARHPLRGAIWIRKSDGMPLRIFATFEHQEPRHTLRDDATVDYVRSPFAMVPVTVAHRHFVDDQPLTENLYTYGPFHEFGSETNIRYTDAPSTPAKK